MVAWSLCWKEKWITKGHEEMFKGDKNGILIVVMKKIPQAESLKYVHLLYVNYMSINLLKNTHTMVLVGTDRKIPLCNMITLKKSLFTKL